MSHDLSDLAQHEGPAIVYGNAAPLNNALQIPDSGYLWNSHVDSILPEAAKISFPLDPCSADIFTFIFYTLSRSEEYTRENRDSWGRFKAENSIAFRENYLQIPYLDLLRISLFELIKGKWGSFQVPRGKYRRQITYDIDIAWAYLHRSFFRQVYGLIRDIFRKDYNSIKQRWRVLNNLEVDPYFSFSRIFREHDTRGDRPFFFCLMGNRSRIDRAVGLRSKAFKQLIRDLSGKYQVGLHPSKRSGDDVNQLQKEYQLLRDYIGADLLHSRQHYLLLNLPETYRNLLALGIRHDYSMGYAEKSGFRAGTCFPFFWYDIDREECTGLTLHPFQAMDITFWVYGRNTPEEVLWELKFLEQQCQAVGGTFIFIAHNNSFSGPGTWSEWEKIFFTFLKKDHL
jgi:hypothetical protein